MSKLGISTGRIPNDGTGDTLLSGAIKINKNFDEIYNYFGDGSNLTFINDGSSRWSKTSLGIHTLSNVGIGTTNPRVSLEVGSIGVSGTAFIVNGDARITGILSIGQETVTINGNNNTITASNIVVTSSITGGGILTTANLVGYATEGYVDNAIVGLITSGALSGYATEGYVDNAVVGFITSGALSGYATEGYVDNAVVGFITSGALSGYATEGYVTNSLVGYATEGYVDNAVVGFITSGALSGYATEGYVDNAVVGFITSGALSGYATEGYVDNAVVGFITSGALSGYATEGYVTNSLVGYATEGYINNIIQPSYWSQTEAGISTLSNVGIGTTNPTTSLTVNGIIKTGIGSFFTLQSNVGFTGDSPEGRYLQLAYETNPNYILNNVGIGTTNPLSKLTVRGGDISVGINTSHGVILTSPNGTQYRLIVDDFGTLSTVAI